MTINPIKISEDIMLVEAQKLMENEHVNSLIVTNEKEELIGIITYKNTL